MITKENARHIYNLYSQIEATNEMINTLTKCKDQYEKDNEGIDVIQDNWKSCKSIEIHIPTRMIKPNASPFDSSTIYQISVPDAILVLENHVVRLQKSLELEQKKIKEE